MWDGFGRKARGKVLSGLRGAGFRDGEGAEKQKRRFWKKEKEIGIALAKKSGDGKRFGSGDTYYPGGIKWDNRRRGVFRESKPKEYQSTGRSD